MSIFSLVENEKMIEIFEASLEDSEFQVEWLAHEAKLYEKLRVYKESLVFLPQSYIYNIFQVGSFISKHLPDSKVVLVLNSKDEFDPAQAGEHDMLFLESNLDDLQQSILSLIHTFKENLRTNVYK
ncbi:hypothetical protein RGU12_10740 [Fredinandcohnia sp. QZ13]|uniref:hypothetical protein n=1 Tax=Fredinandcohnia sp. QZ13 TaxID=3073144 RepID=UPI0028536AAB|nr:hypothetical protein [Fredinandcohnia sp. QZ13]MDR4888024.1 hypothetical protein [Fredinandcohnia sp. QZ13]